LNTQTSNTYIYITSSSHIIKYEVAVVANTFTHGRKDINGGVELTHAQWVISKPKNKIIAHHNIISR